ncbi:MAG: 23S rRNA (pseudouridine(1915)-N(3))-methyltransferase RlmH [Pyrinomonadaceae bacterium]
MRLRLIWPGKTRDARLKALIDEYLKRLSHFTRSEVTELKETARRKGGHR